MTKLWMLAVAVLPLSPVHAQIGGAVGGSGTTATGTAGSGTTVGGNAGQSATGSKTSGGSKNASAKPGAGSTDAKTGTPPASGIGWSGPSGGQGSWSTTGSAGAARSGMPVTTTGF